MNYQWYEQDISDAWVHNLIKTFDKVRLDVFNHTQKWITQPNFKTSNTLNYRWAEWSKSTRTITFSLNLLNNYEWAAVEHIMRHEVAHQIVDELFVIEGKSHGPAWKKACEVVNIDPNVTESKLNLSKFKGSLEENPMVSKIRKLIVHGNDQGISEGESQIFLNKAQALMIKHNVNISLNTNASNVSNVSNVSSVTSVTSVTHGMCTPDNKFYTIRPVGPLVSGHKYWLGQISYLVSQFYNVKSIWLSCTPITECGGGKTIKTMKRIEFYGTPDNLDVAEYVFHALLTQAEYLWEQYKNEHQDRYKNDSDYKDRLGSTYKGNSRRISKKAFMAGLVNGYTTKLQKEKNIILDSIQAEDQAIMVTNDGVLKQAFDAKYNPRSRQSSGSQGRGYKEGRLAGSQLTLAKGVNASTSKQTLLLS